MRVSRLLIAALITGGVFFPGLTNAEIKTPQVTSPSENKTPQNLKSSAENFIEYINYARVALAMKEYQVAKDTLTAAKEILISLKSDKATVTKRTNIQSGRLTYQYEAKGKQNKHYYPINAGPVSVKEVKSGPFFTNNKGVAVTDAEVVYISLDLNNEDIGKNLDEALNDIDNKNYSSAQSNLADISDAIVKEETAVKTPLLRARDNLSLASNFIEYKNYDGARFSLKHADKALDIAERDNNYASRKTRISEMRKEINQLEQQIKANDPTAMEKAGEKIKSWWNELKD